MKHVFLYTYIALLGVSFVQRVFSDALDALITPEQKTVLLTGKSITQLAEDADAPELLPRNAQVQQLTAGIIKELEPTILTESLHLYKKPAGRASWTHAEKIALYNNILALSTLKGLQYYSASRKSMRTFYELSQVIDDPANRTPVKDPICSDPPAPLTVYARQKDLTFGDNVYQYDYFVSETSLTLIQRNLTVMSAGIVPAIGKNKLRSAVAVIDAEEYLLIYAASFAKAIAIPGMKNRIGRSFTNRAEAVLGWFTKQADKAFGR
ncbi:MAG: hypothetical protein LBB61_10225 [Treponema sp.]|jgi:hypothetical protein|nr:hypothetical protein [Treponema sp.]